MSASFDFKAPDLFTAGTIGPPGQRVFYLQGRESGAIATLKLEKEQVGALGEYLGRLLDKLPAADAGSGDLTLLEPVTPAWAVGSLGVGYDEAGDRILVVAEELVGDEASEAPASARFQLTRAQTAAFVERTRALIKAGRPSCRLCGRPMDPAGHICPRLNGHSRD